MQLSPGFKEAGTLHHQFRQGLKSEILVQASWHFLQHHCSQGPKAESLAGSSQSTSVHRYSRSWILASNPNLVL